MQYTPHISAVIRLGQSGDLTLHSPRHWVGDSNVASIRTTNHLLGARFPTGNPENRCITQGRDHVVVFDGVLFNEPELRSRYGGNSAADLLVSCYEAEGPRFCRALRGEYRGFIHHIGKGEWCIFTSHSGSKPLFYRIERDFVAVSSSLEELTRLLRGLRYSCSPDLSGCYMLLTYGFMLEDSTLVSDIKKLRQGRVLQLTAGVPEVVPYFELNNTPVPGRHRDDVIAGLDSRFRDAISIAFDRDRSAGKRSVASLSAGLDSRMVAYVSADLGFEDVLHLNYAQSGSLDEAIPREMARDLGRELIFYPLDRGEYLTRTISDMISANGGLVFYAGASHTMSICRLLDFSTLGTFHSGMIGDAVLGSFLHAATPLPARSGQGATSTRLISRIADIERQVLGRYENEELYRFANRAFNGAHGGTLVAGLFTDMSSAFLDPDFLDYALSIPASMRFGESLYLDWILTRYPRAARMRWGATGVSVRRSRRLHRPLSRIQSALSRLIPTRTMNPLDHWYRINTNLRAYMDEVFSEAIHLLDVEPELQNDSRWLFQSGTIQEKALVLTLLGSWKRLFVTPA